MGELHNDYRTRRFIEDNLVVVTQCLEVVAQEDRQLYAAFLNISIASESVDQGI